MIITPIFPTTLGIVELGREFTKSEIDYIKKLEMRENKGNAVSSNTKVLDSDDLKDLKMFCLESINSYFLNVYKPATQIKLNITQSWINVTRKNEFHHQHHHSNSAFSASFYIMTNDDDKIIFHKKPDTILSFESKEYDTYNSKTWFIPARAGTMVMFPSWLEHSVDTKPTEGNRVSLSFNTFYVGSLGDNRSLTELIL